MKNILLKILILLLAGLATTLTTYLRATEILLTDVFVEQPINFPLETAIIPKTNDLRADQIISQDLFSKDNYKASQALSDNIFWYKLPVQAGVFSQDSKRFVLVIQNNLIERLDIFLFDGKTLIKKKRLGVSDLVIEPSQKFTGSFFAFEINSGKKLDILVRKEDVRTASIPMTLLSQSSFETYMMEIYIFWGMLISLMLVMAVFNSVITFISLHRAYFWYLIFYCVVFVYIATLEGFGLLFWSESTQLFLYRSLFSINFVLLWLGVIFSNIFLDSEKNAPEFYRWKNLFLTLLVIGFIFSLLVPKQKILMLFTVTNWIVSIYIISMSVVVLKKQFYPARFFLAAWISLLVGGFISFAAFNGIIPPNLFTLKSLSVGVALELIFLSIALSENLQYSEKRAIARAFIDPQNLLPNYSYFKNYLLENEKYLSKFPQLYFIVIKVDDYRDLAGLLGKDKFEGAYQMHSENAKKALKHSGWCVPFKLLNQEDGYLISLANDQFLLFANPTHHTINEIVLTLLQWAIHPVYFDKIRTKVNFKIGLAEYKPYETSAQECYNHALMALHDAMSKNTSYTYYDLRQERALIEKLQLIDDLRKAITDKDISIVFQPQFDIKNQKLYGAEVLSRWQHPRLGEIPPSQFIALAEEAGIIFDVTQIIAEKTILWLNEHAPTGKFHLSINLSAFDLQNPSLIPFIRSLKKNYSFDNKHIVFEITESGLTSNQAHFFRVIKELRDLGFKVAIDDFGVEYSSMRYIQLMNADIIKIDSSFVRGIEKSKVNQRIITATVQIAETTKAKTIAEGVQSIEEIEWLKELGIDYVQGYYFSEPLTSEELLKQYIKKLIN
ncbi:MAG: EAL domain-containing protein [Gammaproteobacteria bacterium]|nr:EAL domain-containing protein [Gammaproteobacteria bacterium]MDH5628744.1 EAL domain-containing protein [Gammaproteobacteria bacterium]